MANHPYGMMRTEDNIPFDEGKHPRGPDGKFIFAGGGGGYDFGRTSSEERPTTGNRPWAGGPALRELPASSNRPEMRPYAAISCPTYAGEAGSTTQIPIASEVPPQQEVAMGQVPQVIHYGTRYGLPLIRAGINIHRSSETVNGPEIEEDIKKLEEKQRTGTLTPEEEDTLEDQRKRLDEFRGAQIIDPGRYWSDPFAKPVPEPVSRGKK